MAGYQSPKLQVPFNCEDLKLLWLPSPADVQCTTPRKEQSIHVLNNRFQRKSFENYFNKNVIHKKIIIFWSSEATPSTDTWLLFYLKPIFPGSLQKKVRLFTFLKQNIASYLYFLVRKGYGQVRVPKQFEVMAKSSGNIEYTTTKACCCPQQPHLG